MAEELLKPLNELSYLLECAAVDYTGELKSELAALCGRIKNADVGFCSSAVTASLPELEEALEFYRGGDKRSGAGELARVSRKWWAIAA